MQGYEGVSIIPMPAGLGMFVHDGDVRIALLQQRVSK
jgi:hypothetical protein